MMERAACHTPACHFDPVIFRRLPGGHCAFDCFIHIHFLSLPFALQQSLKGNDCPFTYRKENGRFYRVELQKIYFLSKFYMFRKRSTTQHPIIFPSPLTQKRDSYTICIESLKHKKYSHQVFFTRKLYTLFLFFPISSDQSLHIFSSNRIHRM